MHKKILSESVFDTASPASSFFARYSLFLGSTDSSLVTRYAGQTAAQLPHLIHEYTIFSSTDSSLRPPFDDARLPRIGVTVAEIRISGPKMRGLNIIPGIFAIFVFTAKNLFGLRMLFGSTSFLYAR